MFVETERSSSSIVIFFSLASTVIVSTFAFCESECHHRELMSWRGQLVVVYHLSMHDMLNDMLSWCRWYEKCICLVKIILSIRVSQQFLFEQTFELTAQFTAASLSKSMPSHPAVDLSFSLSLSLQSTWTNFLFAQIKLKHNGISLNIIKMSVFWINGL